MITVKLEITLKSGLGGRGDLNPMNPPPPWIRSATDTLVISVFALFK